MNTVTVKNEYAEILSSFNQDFQSAADRALQQYLVDIIVSKIATLREKDSSFQSKYGCDYPMFSQRTADDENFITDIENNISQLWETDQAEWEFCYKGISDWITVLQNILTTS
jgi:hypothetical protein